ncbi:MAG: DUF885 domain-containing protein, partial [Allosphingosinicella sp.]
MRHLALVLPVFALALSACSRTESPAAAAPAPGTAPMAESPGSQSEALAALFAASDEASLKRNPVNALARGDLRYADRLGDFLSDSYYQAERDSAQSELRALARIGRDSLSPSERISYDVFKWQRELDLRGLQPEMLALTAVRPLDHFNGFHAQVPQLSSGESIAPFKTVKDYENGLARLDDFARLLDQSVERMRQGLAGNIVQPRLVMANVLEQIDSLLAEGVEGSSFYKPLTAFPAKIAAADQARLKSAYSAALTGRVRPALTRLRTFIASDYIPRARASVGLGDMPGGDKLYAYLVEVNTTTSLTPEEIHRIGLENVALLHAEMEKVKRQVGFTGTLKEFFEHIRTDPKFKPASREALQQGYVAIGKRVETTLPRLFRTIPRTALEIRPVPALTEKGAARG